VRPPSRMSQLIACAPAALKPVQASGQCTCSSSQLRMKAEIWTLFFSSIIVSAAANAVIDQPNEGQMAGGGFFQKGPRAKPKEARTPHKR
jgi:hypothetical protein